MESDLFACRLCSNKKDLLDVGSESTQYAAEYRNIVKIMTGIKIHLNDPLSSWICRGCLKRAIENYDYRRSAIQRNLELARKQQENQINKQPATVAMEASKGHSSNESFARATVISDKSDSDVEMGPISFDITLNEDESSSTKFAASSLAQNNKVDGQNVLIKSQNIAAKSQETVQRTTKVVEQSKQTAEDANDYDIDDNSSISSASTIKPGEKSNIASIIQKYPNLKLPQQAYELVFKEWRVNLTHKAVKQHIVKLNRRTRRRPKKRKAREPVDTICQRLDIPETMPTSRRSMKELITSSLGLQRIGPVSPLKAPTPQLTPSKTVPASPQSSFTLPQKTPKKSILHPAVINSPKKFKRCQLSSTLHDNEAPTMNDLIESINKTPTKQDTTITTVAEIGCESPLNLSQGSHDSGTNPDYSLVKMGREEMAYICDYCYSVFGHKGAYTVHRKVHLRCRYCGTAFPNSTTLNLHRKECLKRPREVRVNLVRMESNPSLKNQIPQLFFDLIFDDTQGTSSAQTNLNLPVKAAINPMQATPYNITETKTGLRIVDSAPSPITLSSTSSSANTEINAAQKFALDDSFFALIQKECKQDDSIILSDVESMHLECKSETDADIALEERHTSLQVAAENYECLLMDELFHAQRLLGEDRKKQDSDKVDASSLVKPKDFVAIENCEQTLCVKNLGRVLMTGDIIPVLSKVQKKHLKVKIIDSVPPKKDLIFYDCSKITPISLVSCRQMTNKRRSYNFMPPEEAHVPSTSSCDVSGKTQKRKRKEKAKKEKKIRTGNLIKVRITKNAPNLMEQKSTEISPSNGTVPGATANEFIVTRCSTSYEPTQIVTPENTTAKSAAITNLSSNLKSAIALPTEGTLLNDAPISTETQIPSSINSSSGRSVLRKIVATTTPNNQEVSGQKLVFSVNHVVKAVVTKSNPVLLPAAVPSVDSYLSNLLKLPKEKTVSYLNNTVNQVNTKVYSTNGREGLINYATKIGHPSHQKVGNPKMSCTVSSTSTCTSSFQPTAAQNSTATSLHLQPSATSNMTTEDKVCKTVNLKSPREKNAVFCKQRKKANTMSPTTVEPNTAVANTTGSNVNTPRNLPSFINPAAVYKPRSKGLKILTPNAINEKKAHQGYVRIDNNDVPTYVPLGSIIQKPNIIRYCFNQSNTTQRSIAVSQPATLNSHLPHTSNSQSCSSNNYYSSNSPLVLNHQLGTLGCYNASQMAYNISSANNTLERPTEDYTLRSDGADLRQREWGAILQQDLEMGTAPRHQIMPPVQTSMTIETPELCSSNNTIDLVVNNGVTESNNVQQDRMPPINFLLQK